MVVFRAVSVFPRAFRAVNKMPRAALNSWPRKELAEPRAAPRGKRGFSLSFFREVQVVPRF